MASFRCPTPKESSGEDINTMARPVLAGGRGFRYPGLLSVRKASVQDIGKGAHGQPKQPDLHGPWRTAAVLSQVRAHSPFCVCDTQRAGYTKYVIILT